MWLYSEENIKFCPKLVGFPERLKNLENENGHGTKKYWPKVMEVYQICPRIVTNVYALPPIEN